MAASWPIYVSARDAAALTGLSVETILYIAAESDLRTIGAGSSWAVAYGDLVGWIDRQAAAAQRGDGIIG